MLHVLQQVQPAVGKVVLLRHLDAVTGHVVLVEHLGRFGGHLALVLARQVVAQGGHDPTPGGARQRVKNQDDWSV